MQAFAKQLNRQLAAVQPPKQSITLNYVDIAASLPDSEEDLTHEGE
jgi:hypothetical protein